MFCEKIGLFLYLVKSYNAFAVANNMSVDGEKMCF